MTYGVSVLFLIAVCNFSQYECEKICFSCTGLSEGEKCHNAISCAENEVCFTQKYRTKDNITKYDVGCSYPELCRKDSAGAIFGKRMVDHGHVVCHHCCQDNVCNSVLKCNDNFKVPSLSCLSCSGVISRDQCNTTIACSENEVCFTQKYRTTLNQEYYDLGCKSSTICMNGFYSNILGRRSERERHLLCESCCAGSSYCNRDLLCSHHNQTSVNDSCTTTNGCKSNLICLSEKCQCANGDYYWATDTCMLLKGNNNVCASTKECRKPLQCLSNSCTCPSQQYWDGSMCSAKKMHNAHCKMSAECLDNLFCNHGVCKCDRIDYWTGNNCTARNTFSRYCLSNDDCQETLLCVDNRCRCNTTEFWNGTICLDFLLAPKECDDIEFKANGVFTIYLTDKFHPKPVYCVFQNGTKWTVIQRRFDGSVDFYRNWTSYKNGFGDAHGEYWLGNEHSHTISTDGRHKIRIQLRKTDGTIKYADYSTFSIGDEHSKYLLTLNGYSGSAGDGLLNVQHHGRAAGQKFTTFDKDNDVRGGSNCAVLEHGGWWYNECEYSDLNKLYRNLSWQYIAGHLTGTMMMISKRK